MKYVCFGSCDHGKFEGTAAAERNALFDAFGDYEDHLRADRHWAGGEALQPAETALTLHPKYGKSQLRMVPMRKPRSNPAAFSSLRRGT